MVVINQRENQVLTDSSWSSEGTPPVWSGSLYQKKRRHLFGAVKTDWALTCRTFLGHQMGVTSVTQEGHIPVHPRSPEGVGEG